MSLYRYNRELEITNQRLSLDNWFDLSTNVWYNVSLTGCSDYKDVTFWVILKNRVIFSYYSVISSLEYRKIKA